MIIYKNTYCTLTYISADNIIHLKWLRQPDIKVLLKTYENGIDLAAKYQATSWIADNSIGINFDVSMQRALAELSAKRLNETNIRRFARVVPLDVFHELVSHKMLNMVNQLNNNSLAFELFTSLEDAKSWALGQNMTRDFA